MQLFKTEKEWTLTIRKDYTLTLVYKRRERGENSLGWLLWWRIIVQFLLEPFFFAVICEEEHFADGDARAPLDVLLRARLVLVAHVHDGGRFTPIRFRAEETIEVLLNQGGNTAHRPLLPRPILTSDPLTRCHLLQS